MAKSIVRASTKDLLGHVGRQAFRHAATLSQSERIGLLSECARDWDEVTGWTFWKEGVFDTRKGETGTITWNDFGSVLSAYSEAHRRARREEQQEREEEGEEGEEAPTR